MGKRSNFKRCKADFYRTPQKAVQSLLPHLKPGSRFVEPCAGEGDLITWLTRAGHRCVHARDSRERVSGRMALHGGEIRVNRGRAETLTRRSIPAGGCVITNPPWKWERLLPILRRLLDLDVPAWLLLSADFMHNVQSAPFLDSGCARIVSIGRVKWFADSKHSGMENCCWYLFHPSDQMAGRAPFVPRCTIEDAA